MTDDDRDLAATDALGALPGDEAQRLAERAAQDESLAEARSSYGAIVSALEAGSERKLPPPDLLERIVAAAERDDVAAPSMRPTRRPRLLALVAAVATIAAVVAFVLLATRGDDLGRPTAIAAIAGTPEFPGVHGQAELFDTTEPDGTLLLKLNDVPPPPAGSHYEVWVLRDGARAEMEAVGAFSPGAADLTLKLPLPGAATYAAVDISIQRDAGPAAHSGESLAQGEFDIQPSDS